MPCYNHEKYVAFAIESVLKQTYSNIEIIIIDDGSRDNTWQEISKYKSYPNITCKSRDNKGLIETLKELRRLANGEFLTIIASDDIFCQDKISLMVKAFSEHPNADLCVGRTNIINQHGVVVGEIKNEYDGNGDLYYKLINGLTYISSVSTMIRTTAYRSVEFIDTYIEDLPAWLQLSKNGEAIFVNRVVACYRRMPNSMSSNTVAMIKSEMKIVKLYANGIANSKYPVGWCGRWFKALCGSDIKMARLFLFSTECSKKIYLRIDFYKGVLKAALMVFRKAK
jgi:alpha-1,3-rhamnosyltransferase